MCDREGEYEFEFAFRKAFEAKSNNFNGAKLNVQPYDHEV